MEIIDLIKWKKVGQDSNGNHRFDKMEEGRPRQQWKS